MTDFLHHYPKFAYAVHNHRGLYAMFDDAEKAKACAMRNSKRGGFWMVQKIETVATFTNGVDDTAARIVDPSTIEV